jgi:hypothetical protein
LIRTCVSFFLACKLVAGDRPGRAVIGILFSCIYCHVSVCWTGFKWLFRLCCWCLGCIRRVRHSSTLY